MAKSSSAPSQGGGAKQQAPASLAPGRTSSHPGPGGNWPSTTGQPSGGNRGNASPGSKTQ